jgi:hypothetical protein
MEFKIPYWKNTSITIDIYFLKKEVSFLLLNYNYCQLKLKAIIIHRLNFIEFLGTP